MKTVEFMDLKRQYGLIREEIATAFSNVCEDAAFSAGKYVSIFEQRFSEYLGVKYVSGVDSGTGALFLAIKALGLKSDDEVIVPSATFIASAWGPLQNGVKVVFADCDPDTWTIDINSFKSLITDRTRCVILVHLYGMPCDMDEIMAICNEKGIIVIEDCAQAHGAKYKGKNVGTFGDMGCFSFYPGKNLGAYGEAGAVVSNNPIYIDRVNMYKNHGSKEKYYHDVIGYNMRMDGIQAAILGVKLNHLDEWTLRRQAIANEYRLRISNDLIKFQKVVPGAEPVYHLFEIEVEDRSRFMQYMQDNGIMCAIHYPVACHNQKVIKSLDYKVADCPNATYHADHCVSLPMYPELTDEEVSYVIEVCNRYV